MSPWINVLVTVLLALGGVITQAFLISFLVGREVGKYKERLDAVEAMFMQRTINQDKVLDDLRKHVDSFMKQIAYLEGVVNRRRGLRD